MVLGAGRRAYKYRAGAAMKRTGLAWLLASLAGVIPLLMLVGRKKKRPEIQCIKAPCELEQR